MERTVPVPPLDGMACGAAIIGDAALLAQLLERDPYVFKKDLHQARLALAACLASSDSECLKLLLVHPLPNNVFAFLDPAAVGQRLVDACFDCGAVPVLRVLEADRRFQSILVDAVLAPYHETVFGASILERLVRVSVKPTGDVVAYAQENPKYGRSGIVLADGATVLWSAECPVASDVAVSVGSGAVTWTRLEAHAQFGGLALSRLSDPLTHIQPAAAVGRRPVFAEAPSVDALVGTQLSITSAWDGHVDVGDAVRARNGALKIAYFQSGNLKGSFDRLHGAAVFDANCPIVGIVVGHTGEGLDVVAEVVLLGPGGTAPATFRVSGEQRV